MKDRPPIIPPIPTEPDEDEPPARKAARFTLSRFVILVLAACACGALPAAADPSAATATPAPSPATATAPQPPAASPAPGATAAPAPAQLAIAFDEVERQLGGSATPPPPDAFAQEVQAALDAQQQNSAGPQAPNLAQTAVDMIPVVGSIFQMSQAKKAQQQAKKQEQQIEDQMAGNKPPVLTRYAFYNGWMRVETANSVVITKPDQHLMIFIDPHQKTYHEYDTSVAVQTVTSGPTAAPAPPAGEGSATSLDSTGSVDALTIAGQPVTGFSEEALVTLSGGDGACQDGTFRAKKLEYFSQMAEPLPQIKAQPIDALALPNGCTATIARQQSGGAPPDGQMWLYKLVTVVRDSSVQTQTGSHGGFDPQQMMAGAMHQGSGLPANYMLLSERGNIRQLTAADAPLFDVPAGYTEDK